MSDDHKPRKKLLDEDDPEDIAKNIEIKQTDIIIPFKFDGYDTFMLIILIFMGIFSRFWLLWSPRTLVSEDLKYLSFIHCYANETFCPDQQPPLGKMILRYLAQKMEYKDEYKIIGLNATYPTTVYHSLRSISAFFSFMTIPVVYFTIRCLNIPTCLAFLGGSLCLFEYSLIASSRFIGDRGISQFMLAASLMFCSFSMHFITNSYTQFVFILLQALFAGFAISISFMTFPIYIFAIVWTFIKTHDIKTIIYAAVIPIAVLYLSCIVSLLMGSKKVSDTFKYNKYIDSHLSGTDTVHLQMWHLIGSFIMILKIFIGNITSINFNILLIFRKLFFREKWYVLWSSDDRYSACFTNTFITTPSLFFAILFTISNIKKKAFNSQTLFVFLFIITLILYAFTYTNYGPLESYTVMILNCIQFPISISNLTKPANGYSFSIAMFVIALLTFIDLCTLVYAYIDPAPVLPKWFI